jgi:hypothetical protein
MRRVRLRRSLFRGAAEPPTLEVTTFRGRDRGRRLRPGERRPLKLKFKGTVSEAAEDYAITIVFAEGCAVELAQGQTICTPAVCGCRVGDRTRRVGETFPAGDGCNTCNCMPDGAVSCTKIKCADGCLVNGQFYEIGESFPAGDGCNTCTCVADGEVACTEIGCPACEYNGAIYQPGDIFPAGDGCNTCMCLEGGYVACTQIACHGVCYYEGEIYQPGDTFPAGDGCNTCTCLENGTVACTLIPCPVCEYSGNIYRPGDTFPAGDGCNTCFCLEDGTVACTEIACPVVCEYNGQVYQPGDTFLDGDCCNICTCLASGAVSCTDQACPVGCFVDGVFYADGESFPAGDGCNFCTCVNGVPLCTLMPCIAPPCRSLDFESCQASGYCEWLVPGCGPNPIDFEAGCYSSGECETDAECARDELCQQVTVNPCWSPDPDGVVCTACGWLRTVCMGPRTSDEQLCVDTGGRWDPISCGHYHCGFFPECDAVIPGCDCGAGLNFKPGLGCIPDPQCAPICTADSDCPPGSMCNNCNGAPCNSCRPRGCVPLFCDFEADCPPGSRCVGSSVCPPDVTCVWEGRPGLCLPDDTCCDPAAQPDAIGNAPCMEGASCCDDGRWACNQGDGSPSCEPGPVCEPATAGTESSLPEAMIRSAMA